MRTLLLTVGLLPVSALAATPLDAYDHNVARGLQPATDQLVVRSAQDLDTLDRAAATVGCAVDHRWGRTDWYTLRCVEGPPRSRVAALSDRAGVTWVQVPFPAELTVAPNDLDSRQWHHRNTGQTVGGQTGVAGVDLGSLSAWDVTTGDDTALVAVIDTGVYLEHSELAGRIWQNPGEVCGNGVDDDSNGYIDDCTGWDPADGDNDPDPRSLPTTADSGAACVPFHGTFISGLVAGAGNNGAGGTGVLWDGRVLPLKMVTDDGCKLYDTTLAEGVQYATDQGARVINASWGFSGSSTALSVAFSNANAAGVILVIAAGNDNEDIEGTTRLPVAYRLSNDLVVAATTNKDERASFSNWGATDVDLGAPGARLWSTGINSDTHHQISDGTSFAAPLVAGVASLVWSAYPMLRASEVRSSLLDGAEPIAALDCGSTSKCVATGARLSAVGALEQAETWATTPALRLDTLQVRSDDDGDGVAERGERAAVALSVENTGHAATGTLTAVLTVTHPDLSPDPQTLDLPAVAAYERATSTDSLLLDVPLACVQDVDAVVQIDLTDDATGGRWSFSSVLPVLCDVDDDNDGVRYPDDCDDDDPDVSPEADERCNGVDDDCDGDLDEDDALDAVPWYPDQDGDTYGAAGTPVTACRPPDGYGGGTLDCDDFRDDVHPGADEVCDDTDNDCNGIPDDDAIDALTYFIDQDGDGWGTDETVLACTAPRFTADRSGDCDDSDSSAFPDSERFDASCNERPKGLFGSCSTTETPTSLMWLGAVLLLAVGRRRQGLQDRLPAPVSSTTQVSRRAARMGRRLGGRDPRAAHSGG